MGLFDLNVFGMPGFRIKNYNFTNVHVFHKTINSVRHGACSQKLGGVQIFYSSHFNSMQKLELQNQFEGKVHWSNLSFMGKHSHNKGSLGLKTSKLVSEKCIVHLNFDSMHLQKEQVPEAGNHKLEVG